MEQGRTTYFIRQVGVRGPIKIGFSRRPYDRLKTYMTWSPVPLAIVATVEGGLSTERRFHVLLAEYHSHHEWFHPAPEVEAIVAAVAAGTFDLGTLPAPQLLSKLAGHTSESRSAAGYQQRLTAMINRGEAVPDDVLAARYCYNQPPEELARRRSLIRSFVDHKQAVESDEAA